MEIGGLLAPDVKPPRPIEGFTLALPSEEAISHSLKIARRASRGTPNQRARMLSPCEYSSAVLASRQVQQVWEHDAREKIQRGEEGRCSVFSSMSYPLDGSYTSTPYFRTYARYGCSLGRSC